MWVGVYIHNMCIYIYTVLVTYCCVTNHPKIKWLKITINAYFFILTECQECGSGLAGWFCLRLTLKIAVEMLARAASIWRLAWTWRVWFYDDSFTCLAILCCLLSRRLTSSTRIFLYGCLRVLITWQLAFPRRSNSTERAKRKLQCQWPNLRSHSRSSLQCFIGYRGQR